jgi:hypothetical protein
MSTKLPTKPGPYYWREKDGDEWEIHTVFIDDELNNTLMASCPIDDTWYATENWGGQWLPIPTAEELVELQAKAKAYVEGETAACIFCPDGKFVLARINAILAWDDLEVIKMDIKRDLRNQGYTCHKVRVFKEVENEKGKE